MSFANVQLYNAVIPTYSPKASTGKNKDEDIVLNGDDPANQEAINKALFESEDE